MIEVIQKKICDVCKKEVDSFAGSLKLEYTNIDHTGCECLRRVVYKDICIYCCRKLDKAIEEIVQNDR